MKTELTKPHALKHILVIPANITILKEDFSFHVFWDKKM
jgi:hypothetical protein